MEKMKQKKNCANSTSVSVHSLLLFSSSFLFLFSIYFFSHSVAAAGAGVLPSVISGGGEKGEDGDTFGVVPNHLNLNPTDSGDEQGKKDELEPQQRTTFTELKVQQQNRLRCPVLVTRVKRSSSSSAVVKCPHCTFQGAQQSDGSLVRYETEKIRDAQGKDLGERQVKFVHERIPVLKQGQNGAVRTEWECNFGRMFV